MKMSITAHLERFNCPPGQDFDGEGFCSGKAGWNNIGKNWFDHSQIGATAQLQHLHRDRVAGFVHGWTTPPAYDSRIHAHAIQIMIGSMFF